MSAAGKSKRPASRRIVAKRYPIAAAHEQQVTRWRLAYENALYRAEGAPDVIKAADLDRLEVLADGLETLAGRAGYLLELLTAPEPDGGAIASQALLLQITMKDRIDDSVMHGIMVIGRAIEGRGKPDADDLARARRNGERRKVAS